jgi:G3E family GTPase
MITAMHGEVAPDRLFGAALFDPARKTPDVQAWLRPERHERQAHAHDEGEEAHHGSGVHSFCLTFDDPLPWQSFANWLQMLRQWRGEDLLRVKGFCTCRRNRCWWRSRRASRVPPAGAVRRLAG